jgi:hypothetical protein
MGTRARVENLERKGESMKTKKNEYPTWVFRKCGEKASSGRAFGISSYHMDECGVCGKHTAVTESRDFFYPEFKKGEIKK